jgi:hypothetical protein
VDQQHRHLQVFGHVEEVELVIFVVAIDPGDAFDVFQRVRRILVEFTARLIERRQKSVAPLDQTFDAIDIAKLVARSGSKVSSGSQIVTCVLDEAVELVLVHPRRIVQQVGEGAALTRKRLRSAPRTASRNGAVQQRFACPGQVHDCSEKALTRSSTVKGVGMLSPTLELTGFRGLARVDPHLSSLYSRNRPSIAITPCQ